MVGDIGLRGRGEGGVLAVLSRDFTCRIRGDGFIFTCNKRTRRLFRVDSKVQMLTVFDALSYRHILISASLQEEVWSAQVCLFINIDI